MTRIHIPNWLRPIMGQRERRIAATEGVRCLATDDEGNRLPHYQQIIETPTGERFTIDARRRAIIG
jgi:hypothetical protein